jgi:ubiquitin C-terminal hydrolase
LNRIFGGKLRNKIIGKSCEHVKESYETFLEVQLPVKNMSSLHEGIKSLLVENLEGDNQYFCNECDKKVDA